MLVKAGYRGGAMASLLGCGFVPIRKPRKLPWKTFRHEYELEYGTATLEIHSDDPNAPARQSIGRRARPTHVAGRVPRAGFHAARP